MWDWLVGTFFAGLVMLPTGVILLLTLGGAYDGGMTLIGIVLVPAMMSFFFICIASLVGLPLRLIPRARKAWRRHWWVSAAVAFLGLLLVFVSRLVATTEVVRDELGHSYESFPPHPVIFFAGALILAFGLVHTWFGRESYLPTS